MQNITLQKLQCWNFIYGKYLYNGRM